MHSIYLLKDPITFHVVYIGQTNQSLSMRLAGHLLEQKSSGKKAWIDGLKGLNLKPIIELIEEVSDGQVLVREEFWIKHFYEAGATLFNIQGRLKLVTFDELEWFKRNRTILKESKIEKELGMAQGTLTKAATSRGLPSAWHAPFKKWVNDFLAD